MTTADEILALAASAADSLAASLLPGSTGSAATGAGGDSARTESTGTGSADVGPTGIGSAGVGPADAEALERAVAGAVEATEAEFAVFGRAAARGADSAVVRALLSVLPPAATSARPPGDPAWTAWLTAAAAVAADDTAWASAGNDARTTANGGTAGPPHPAWFAVFATATALANAPEGGGPTAGGSGRAAALAAVAAGLSTARIIESGLDDWDGWSSGTVAAAIGAGVTAGLLLGLTQPQLRAAIGICATQAAGLASAEGTDAFALQIGKAAFNGVEAAVLARAGLTAPADPLDGRRGLFALFGP
jgi:2-methylcitrate dehydratase MmgE/PrpD-like protein